LIGTPIEMTRGSSDGFVLVVDHGPPYLDAQRWVVFVRAAALAS
jgi:hypothetical protein